MKLSRVVIEGYRSIREPLTLEVDAVTTILLAANDHGKTNVLDALVHLNEEASFEVDDINLDCAESTDCFPAIRFILVLSDAEQEALRETESRRHRISVFDALVSKHRRSAADYEKKADAARARLEAATADIERIAGELETALPRTAERKELTAEMTAAKTEERAAKKDVANLDRIATMEQQRLDIAIASQIEAQADADSPPIDLRRHATRLDASSKRLARVLRKLQNEAQEDAAAIELAGSTHGEGTPEYTAAVQRSRASSIKAEEARRRAAEERTRAENARRAVSTRNLDAQGKLSFDPKDFLPTAADLALEAEVPAVVEFVRTGLAGKRGISNASTPSVSAWLATRVPRVELIHPQERLTDVVTSTTIFDEDNDFMRGIFRYAGLERDEWKTVFKQDDQTDKRLDMASEELNTTLRQSWSQGRELRFKLSHQGKEIHLRIDDPSVKTGYVRATRRSSGFAHFFALKTMLHAREQETGASSYIWLFDEPGIFLHPKGQYDLIQELETIAKLNQVVYSTHSIFLINKNHPTRHRLLTKTEQGTTVDHKPYVGQWQAAIDSLGLAFPGSFMFASKVLLVEGDSDPIMLNADMTRLIDLGLVDLDLNSLSVMMTGDSKHADAMIRILRAPPEKPDIALLFDADSGGRDRRKSLKKLIASLHLPVITLDRAGTTIEDHLLRPDLFKEAVIIYVETACAELGIHTNVRESLEQSHADLVDDAGNAVGLAHWSRTEGRRLLQDDDPPSSVGIANEYAKLMGTAEIDAAAPATQRSIALARTIAEKLKLAPQTLEQHRITGG